MRYSQLKIVERDTVDKERLKKIDLTSENSTILTWLMKFLNKLVQKLKT